MSKEIRDKLNNLYRDKQKLTPYIIEYNYIESNIAQLKSLCKHENAYWYSQYRDDYEGRLYDNIICPDCDEKWDERCVQGNHKYQSNEEYLNKR
jgi:hypothetical protein